MKTMEFEHFYASPEAALRAMQAWEPPSPNGRAARDQILIALAEGIKDGWFAGEPPEGQTGQWVVRILVDLWDSGNAFRRHTIAVRRVFVIQ